MAFSVICVVSQTTCLKTTPHLLQTNLKLEKNQTNTPVMAFTDETPPDLAHLQEVSQMSADKEEEPLQTFPVSALEKDNGNVQLNTNTNKTYHLNGPYHDFLSLLG